MMKPIVFVRISSMYLYKGITDQDEPYGAGSYVAETGDAHEAYNFKPEFDPEIGEDVCFGFFMLNGAYGNDVALHFEKINGCEALKDEEILEGVTVVFCAKSPGSKTTRVVGFYKNATMYRHLKEAVFTTEDGGEYYQAFNFEAKAKDCILLPFSVRHSDNRWYVPHVGVNGATYGLGHSNIFYGDKAKENPELYNYLEKMIKSTEEYNGENWLYKEIL